MPIPLLMPALSPTMTEGNLVKWFKKAGDKLNAGDLIAEIETDKATMEVEVVDEGVLGKILVPQGSENVKVNQIIAYILEDGEDITSLDNIQADNTPQTQNSTSPKLDSQKNHVNENSSSDQKLETVKQETSSNVNNSSDQIFATPLAKRIAEQNQINLKNINGSGGNGRIIKADIENLLSKQSNYCSNSTDNFADAVNTYEDINLNNMRKVIAKRLTESKQNIPHFYLSIDCDLESLLQIRKQINDTGNNKLSVNDFVIKATGLSLASIPEANVTFHDTFIRSYKNADISVAVAIDGGLITPIIKNANLKSVSQISKEMKNLAEKARSGKLKPEEYQGGTFSISNLGMYGIKEFKAIINPPQACILAVGSGEKRVIFKDGKITASDIMTCTLSIDHRALDGAVASKLLSKFKELIENPVRLLNF
jgi:pyruvate dehydrogenase E2 component (dihydrolipoamide acetyltransferase)